MKTLLNRIFLCGAFFKKMIKRTWPKCGWWIILLVGIIWKPPDVDLPVRVHPRAHGGGGTFSEKWMYIFPFVLIVFNYINFLPTMCSFEGIQTPKFRRVGKESCYLKLCFWGTNKVMIRPSLIYPFFDDLWSKLNRKWKWATANVWSCVYATPWIFPFFQNGLYNVQCRQCRY